jgi:subtilase family serine protease
MEEGQIIDYQSLYSELMEEKKTFNYKLEKASKSFLKARNDIKLLEYQLNSKNRALLEMHNDLKKLTLQHLEQTTKLEMKTALLKVYQHQYRISIR